MDSAFPGQTDAIKPIATVLRDAGTGQEKRLSLPLFYPRWSPHGSSVVGEPLNGHDLKTRAENKIASLPPLISTSYLTYQPSHTAPFREGRSELWLADITK